MNLENLFNNLNWKKVTIISISTFAVLFIIHDFIFWSYFHETKQVIAEINSQISQQQKDIQQKLADSDKEFNERGKRLDAKANDISNQVEQFQSQVNNYLVQAEHEREEREKVFNKAFKEAPEKMWAEHEKFGAEMRKEFFKESKQMQKDFQNNLANKK